MTKYKGNPVPGYDKDMNQRHFDDLSDEERARILSGRHDFLLRYEDCEWLEMEEPENGYRVIMAIYQFNRYGTMPDPNGDFGKIGGKVLKNAMEVGEIRIRDYIERALSGSYYAKLKYKGEGGEGSPRGPVATDGDNDNVPVNDSGIVPEIAPDTGTGRDYKGEPPVPFLWVQNYIEQKKYHIQAMEVTKTWTENQGMYDGEKVTSMNYEKIIDKMENKRLQGSSDYPF